MAVTLAMRQFKRTQLSATPDVVTRLDLPADAHQITIQFVSYDGKISHTGTDGQAIGSDYWTLKANTGLELKLADVTGRQPVGASFSVYVASGTASTYVETFVE